jgi:hypothetical protein
MGEPMTDKVTNKLERRNAELSRINDSLERWHRKLTRAVTAIDRLRAEKKRLLKPRQLEKHEALKIDGREWHKIREQEFGDAIQNL